MFIDSARWEYSTYEAPIDNTTLLRYQGLPPKLPKPRRWWVAPLVFFGACAVMFAAGCATSGSVLGTRIVVVACVGGAMAWWLSRLYIGWQENGVIGLLYRDENPTGSILANDDERDGLALALNIVAVVALLVAGVLIALTPAAFPSFTAKHVPSPNAAPANTP